MTQDMITLGFDRIIEQLQNQAVSQAARSRLAETEKYQSRQRAYPCCDKTSVKAVY